MNNAEVWLRLFCVSAGRAGHLVKSGNDGDENRNYLAEAAGIADRMLVEYENRYGDRAVIAKGIRTCDGCGSQDLTGAEYVQQSGILKAFCATCVGNAEKGELPKYPGIATPFCRECGQQESTIFSCPGEPEPFPNLLEGFELTEEQQKIDAAWRVKLASGTPHTFVTMEKNK